MRFILFPLCIGTGIWGYASITLGNLTRIYTDSYVWFDRMFITVDLMTLTVVAATVAVIAWRRRLRHASRRWYLAVYVLTFVPLVVYLPLLALIISF